MEDIMIGGVTQRIWFRGVDRSKPALILLHGGPGASEAALFRHLNKILIERLWAANRYSRRELLDACLAADLRITGFKRFPLTYFWQNVWGNIVEATPVV